MTKVFLEYDEAKDNYKIVVFVGSEMLTLDGDDVRVPSKFRVVVSDPIEPKVDDDWFGATLSTGEQIDINLFREEDEPTIYVSVYPVDEDGHIDTAHPILSLGKVSYITKKYYTGWTGSLWVVAKNQSHIGIYGEMYDSGYSLYTRQKEVPFLESEGGELEFIDTRYSIESLVEQYIFKEVD